MKTDASTNSTFDAELAAEFRERAAQIEDTAPRIAELLDLLAVRFDAIGRLGMADAAEIGEALQKAAQMLREPTVTFLERFRHLANAVEKGRAKFDTKN